MEETQMKAIVHTQYGSPDVLQFKEVEKPAPRDGEILVKIQAASANPLDWHLMRGAPFLARLAGGLRKPKDPRLGADLAGRVEAVGSNVSQFQPGDEVFGAGTGSFAEYASVPANTVALKPATSSFEQAAAIPVAALTALQGLRHTGHIQPGQKVLVNGASGGVGTFAVQMAKAFGAEVTGVCSTRNMELVRSIGADHVIDYTQADFTTQGQHYDLIYDAVGNRSVSAYKRALNPNGTCVIVGFQNLPRLFEHMVLGPLRSKTGNKKVGLMGMAKMNQQDLVYVKELLEAGKVVPVIERRYPLGETAQALRYLEQGHARGKVVITVDQNDNT
jgi:2-desacetyl-2-hydroxyethyl bacteriochlorophyllide A dehydrogenase